MSGRSCLTIAVLILLAFTALASAAITLWLFWPLATKEDTTPTPDLAQIQKLADLTVLKAPVSESVRATIEGDTGATHAVVMVHGHLWLSTDLASAEVLRRDERAKHLVLSLPEPTVHNVSIDSRKTRVLVLQRSGLWRLALGSALEDETVFAALRESEDRLTRTVPPEILVNQAKAQAQRVLRDFGRSIGWTIEMRWRSAKPPDS